MMKAEVIRPGELDDGLLEVWRQMQAGNPSLESPFFSPEFTLAVGGARDDARVAVISIDGEVRAFLPFHLCSGNVAKPIGGQICDYQGLIHDADFTATGSDILRASRLTAYDFNHAPVAQSALIGGSYKRWSSPQMDLTGGYEAYSKDRSKKFRNAMSDVRRTMRKIEEQFGPLRFVYQDMSDDAYDVHVALRNKLYERANVKSLLGANSWVDKAIEVLRGMDAANFAGLFSTLYAGDHLVAGHFGLRSRDVWHWWIPSYDTQFHKFGPGKTLIHLAAQTAENHGLTKIDLGRGNAPYKMVFANSFFELMEGSIEATLSLPGISRRVQRVVAKSAQQLPLGRYGDICRRAGSRVLTGGVRV